MSPPLRIVEAAESFWAEAGMPLAFPRDVRRAIARSLPVTIVLLPALHVARAEDWLRRQGRDIEIGVADRPLRACLVAQSGSGIIFVDGADAESEQRFSIAHELAHYLLDYLAPRHAAVATLGEGILEVLDGVRPARPDERAIALLAGVSARRHIHLMGRDELFGRATEIDRSETAADTLATELLAPWDLLSWQIVELGISQDRSAIARLLMDHYGLPMAPAARYAARLSPNQEPASPLLRHLRRVELSSSMRNTVQGDRSSGYGLP